MSDQILIKGAVVFDSANGESIRRDIAVKAGKVVDASSLVNPQIVDASGLTAMFGLWD